MKPLVLHVLPMDLARGAQRYAAAMRETLGGPQSPVRHEIVTLFEPIDHILEAEHALGVSRRLGRRLGFAPRAALGLRRALTRLKPALVVAHGSEPLKYLVAARSDAPVVYYKIGVAHGRMQAPHRRRLHAWLLRQADLIAGVSHECLDEVRERFGVRGEHVLIPNGRDPERFFPRAEARPADEPPRLIFVGHLSRTKRPGLFIEIVRRLRAQGHRFRACMAGDGPLRASLVQPARDAGVELLGRRDDVPELLRASDVFVFTSVPEGEGLPGVFIEAGLSGLPIVSTRVPGSRTSILDGKTGFIVPSTDVEGLVERCGQLVSDEGLRATMGRAARAHCAAELTLAASLKRWQPVIERFLPAGGASASQGGRVPSIRSDKPFQTG